MAEEQTARTQGDARPSSRVDASTFRQPPRTATRDRTQSLEVCPSCHSDLVYPIDWAPADRKRWSVELYCPDCQWNGGGVYNQDVVDRFDEALDRGTEQLLDDLNLLTRANMEEQVERFLGALHADQILPEDF